MRSRSVHAAREGFVSFLRKPFFEQYSVFSLLSFYLAHLCSHSYSIYTGRPSQATVPQLQKFQLLLHKHVVYFICQLCSRAFLLRSYQLAYRRSINCLPSTVQVNFVGKKNEWKTTVRCSCLVTAGSSASSLEPLFQPNHVSAPKHGRNCQIDELRLRGCSKFTGCRSPTYMAGNLSRSGHS